MSDRLTKMLTDQLVLLAKRAGYQVWETNSERMIAKGSKWLWYGDSKFSQHFLFGASGTLDTTEVGLVLDWLTAAGFIYSGPWERKPMFLLQHMNGDTHVEGDGKTTHEALTEALLKLELSEPLPKWIPPKLELNDE